MVSQIKVDSVLESTSAAGVTIDGVLIKDNAIASSYISGLTDTKLVLLNTTTISSDATVSIDNFVDPSTYVYYKVIGENIKPATNGQQFQYYFRTGGASGSDITSGYSFSGTHTSGFESNLSYGTSIAYPFSGVSNASGEELNFIGEFFPNNGSSGDAWFKTDSMYKNDSGNANRRTYIFTHGGTTQVTGLKFKMGNGNLTSGKFYIYGVKK